jgi:RNA polymerase sigma-70 factor (ECF subfamily)
MQPDRLPPRIIEQMSGIRGQADLPGRLSHTEERALIERALNGCEEGARRLIDAHKDRLFAFVGRIIRDHHDVEEICQEAFLRAFANLQTFSAEYRFSTWLFTIGYRLCLNHLRRKQAVTGEMEFSTLASVQADGPDEVAGSEEAARLRSLVWEAVDELNPTQKAAVLLFYREGRSCQEISEVLNMPTATVKSHLHRARQRLREKLEPVIAEDWSRLDLLHRSA